jgi:hypothetical protein
MVRYPVGGIHLWMLSWLLGFKSLGHDVYFVEKNGWPDSCYDLTTRVMSDDCSYGVRAVSDLLSRFELDHNWCFVDARGRYHGLPRERVTGLFESADLFVDFEGSEWLEEAAGVPLRVMVDSEPGWHQMRLEQQRAGLNGGTPDYYHRYYTIGLNIGTCYSSAPTASRHWRPILPPILVELFPYHSVNRLSPFTTVMNWNAHKHIEFGGVVYGQKAAEFAKFMNLPERTPARMQIAVSGTRVPRQELINHGWDVLNADDLSVSIDAYKTYILGSKGEFSVAKHVYVATNSGWFSHQGGYYLASGRPVVVQETGFSRHLPTGNGLFAVNTVEEAADAIEVIDKDLEKQSRCAREIALEFFDARRVLKDFLDAIN